jgi:phosphate/sulfate permease
MAMDETEFTIYLFSSYLTMQSAAQDYTVPSGTAFSSKLLRIWKEAFVAQLEAISGISMERATKIIRNAVTTSGFRTEM